MWYWFGLAALALIGEIFSGTFYLLLVAVAFVVAGGVAALDMGLAAQLVVCAIIIVLGALALRRAGVLKTREDASANADVNLDIGQEVNIAAWEADGTARVWYRGAHWEARAQSGYAPRQTGPHRIIAVRGNQLILEPLQ